MRKYHLLAVLSAAARSFLFGVECRALSLSSLFLVSKLIGGSFGEWWLPICLSRLYLLVKSLGQWQHLKERSRVCTIWWGLSADNWLKHLLHLGHLKGRSPVWDRWWIVKLAFARNALPHILHTYDFFFLLGILLSAVLWLSGKLSAWLSSSELSSSSCLIESLTSSQSSASSMSIKSSISFSFKHVFISFLWLSSDLRLNLNAIRTSAMHDLHIIFVSLSVGFTWYLTQAFSISARLGSPSGSCPSSYISNTSAELRQTRHTLSMSYFVLFAPKTAARVPVNQQFMLCFAQNEYFRGSFRLTCAHVFGATLTYKRNWFR